jgi:hypothetical protein
MPAQSTIEICPPQILSENDGYSHHMTSAAKPATNATATGGGGLSEADKAAMALAGKVTTRLGQLSGELAGLGPEATSQTQAGVRQMQQTDDDNAEEFRALGSRVGQIFGRAI